MAPKMKHLLGSHTGGGRRSWSRVFGGLQAITGIVALVTGCWTLVHSVEEHLHAYPGLIVAYPLIGMGTLVLLVPLIVFLSFQTEFQGLSPLWPPHFLFLLRRLVGASQQNNLKVSAKEL